LLKIRWPSAKFFGTNRAKFVLKNISIQNMAAPEVPRVFNRQIIYPYQTHLITINIAADGRPNYLACGYSLLPGQWDNRLIKTPTKVKAILKVGSYAKAYLSGFVEEALNETMEKTPVN
jgi:hypothetical protein